MAGHTEQDPLLPNDKSSPEIHGSRPQSITDDYVKEDIQDDEPPRRSIWNDPVTYILWICLLLIVVLFFMPLAPFNDEDSIPRTIDQRVNQILAQTPLIDGHNDLAVIIRFLYKNQIYSDNFTSAFEEGPMYSHVDLPRLKEGRSGGAFWSTWAPCPKKGDDYSDENYAETVKFTFGQIDVLTRLQAAYPSVFSLPPNSTTALSAFRSGQLISPLAIEGLHQIGNAISNLRHYHALGVRYATLTHNCHNNYADAALVETSGGGIEKSKPRWGGVSPAGRDAIQEMNRLGMIVDLAHVSQDTMRDVLGAGKDWAGSAAPIMFSHSSAYALCPHPRNVPDDVLQLVKEKNGIVMVNFSPDFISCVANSSNPTGIPDFYPKNSTLEHVVRHVMHIGNLIGYDHVGLGSDYDGILSTPKGLEDVSKFPALVAEMLNQGISDEDASKVTGGNILRVWTEVDALALKMQRGGVKPVEDKVPGLEVTATEV